MAYLPLPDQTLLKQLLDYDPETGILTWRMRGAEMFNPGRWHPEASAASWNGAFAGKRAFTALTANGYHHGLIFRRELLAHRVIWKWFYGTEPLQVDHLNHDRADNRIANLRSVSASVNKRNQRLNLSNTSGCAGVVWAKREKKWQAAIRNGGKRVFLGYFVNFEDAVSARRAAEKSFGYRVKEGRRA